MLKETYKKQILFQVSGNCGIFLSADVLGYIFDTLTGCCTSFSAILNYIFEPVHQKHVTVTCPLSSTVFAKSECLALLS